MAGSASKIKISSYDDLLASPSKGDESIIEVSLKELHEFKNHPFKVLNDEKMEELVESIKEKGVLIPAIARPRMNGGYELIAGHRRKYASELAGKNTMPVKIYDYTDKEAAEIMVDTNIQRGDLSYSEKAYAYKIRYGAIRKQGQRTDLSLDKSENRENKLENEVDSKRTIQRYISLTNLIKPLLDLVDLNKLSFLAGVELSYLRTTEQMTLFNYMTENKGTPSVEQAEEIHQYSKNEKFDYDLLVSMFEKKKKQKHIKVALKPERLLNYFNEEYSKAEMEDIIYSLLEEWKQKSIGDKDSNKEMQIPGQESIETLNDGEYMPS